jgi:hypothetical protein
MNYCDELVVRNMNQTSKHDVQTPQTQTAPPQDSDGKDSSTEVKICGRETESGICPDAHKHVHFAGGISAQCQNPEHNHLQKLKSPPPKSGDEAEGHLNLHKILRKDPIADIEAKAREILHPKHLHSDKDHSAGEKTNSST